MDKLPWCFTQNIDKVTIRIINDFKIDHSLWCVVLLTYPKYTFFSSISKWISNWYSVSVLHITVLLLGYIFFMEIYPKKIFIELNSYHMVQCVYQFE